MHFNAHINPSPNYALAMGEAIQNNNEGLALKQRGMYEDAEKKYLKALDLKLTHIGENAITTALSHNALGELYIAMNRLDDAEKHLDLAVKIRNADGPTFDAATSRENLAIIYEMRGDLKAAKQMRKSTGKYACGNYDVRSISHPLNSSEADHSLQCPGQVFNKSELKHCGKCTACVFFDSCISSEHSHRAVGYLLLHSSVPGKLHSDEDEERPLTFITTPESGLETSQKVLPQIGVNPTSVVAEPNWGHDLGYIQLLSLVIIEHTPSSLYDRMIHLYCTTFIPTPCDGLQFPTLGSRPRRPQVIAQSQFYVSKVP